MRMAFPDDVVTVLEMAGVGTYETDLFIGSNAKIPNGDGPYLSIVRTQGLGPMPAHDNVRSVRRPRAQIVCRGKSSVAAEQMAEDAHKAIQRVVNRFVNSTHYPKMRTLQDPFDLGADERGRTKFVFNIEADQQGVA